MILVDLANSEIIKFGQHGTLTTLEIEFSSAFVGKIYRGEERLCTIMCHRGIETRFKFTTNLYSTLKEYLPLSTLRVEAVAIQTGPNTRTDNSMREFMLARNEPVGLHSRTDIELIANMSFLFRLKYNELVNLTMFGPRVDKNSNICGVKIEDDGTVNMQTISGIAGVQQARRTVIQHTSDVIENG